MRQIKKTFLLFLPWLLSAAMVLLIPSSAQADINTGLVGYWNMDSADIDWSTNTILDHSGTGNKGTLTGLTFAASSIAGRIGEALKFESAGTYINIPYSQTLTSSITNSLTYAAWVRVDSAPVNWEPIISNSGQGLQIYKSGLLLFKPGGTTKQLVAYTPGNSPTNSVGTWFHLAATFDGERNTIYINGAVTCSSCTATTTGTAGNVGAYKIAGGTTYPFVGALDEVRVYNRALSVSEIQTLYNSTSFDTAPLKAPAVPSGLVSSAQTADSISLSWNANTETDLASYKVYKDNSLIAVVAANTTSHTANGLTAGTAYNFSLSSLNTMNMESSKTASLAVSTSGAIPAPSTVEESGFPTPGQYLNGRPHPIFKPGNTLPPLTKWSWPYSFEMKVAMADWGYALDFGDADDATVSRLANPSSNESKLIALVNSNPSKYKLFVGVPRVPSSRIPTSAYVVDSSGNPTTTWSPEAPDSVLSEMASYLAGNFRQVASKAPIFVILNGGERYLGVCGWDCQKWKLDSKVIAAKGSLIWGQYISQRKAHQELIFANAIRGAANNAKYIWYATGNTNRAQSCSNWIDWGWDYKDMRVIQDYPSSEAYWSSGDNNWTGHLNMTGCLGTSNEDILSNALNAIGYELKFGQPLSYNWLSSGWEGHGYGDMARYFGFLKSYYTAGMIGGVAGYFAYPTGGFNATFDSNYPPDWIKQIETLGQVHAEFSYLEDILRNGDLLPGEDMNPKNSDQPAYEFRTGYADTRVLARKMRGQKRWLISAWAADNVTRTVSVTIPVLGAVSVKATPSGSLYDARVVNGAMSLTQIDNGSQNPTPLSLPSSTPDSDGSAYTPPVSVPLAGTCSSSPNTCSSGTLSDQTDTATTYLWSCQGSGGGSTASCSLPIPPGETPMPVVTPTPTPTPTPEVTPAQLSPGLSSTNISNITTTGAQISWTTPNLSIGWIEYGLTPSYGNTTPPSTFYDKYRLVNLTNLLPNTVYHYRIRSRDYLSVNVLDTADQTFTTLSNTPTVIAPLSQPVSKPVTQPITQNPSTYKPPVYTKPSPKAAPLLSTTASTTEYQDLDPKIPSWMDVILNFFETIVSAIGRGVGYTWESVRGVVR